MSTFRFVHCADLHLGRRFVGLSDTDVDLGVEMAESSFRALDAVIDKAIDSDAGFIVFAGDIFDDTEQTPRVRMRFAEALGRFGGQCYIAYGNHDYARKWEDSIPLPPNAHVFPRETGRFLFPEDAPVAEIVGRSFSSRYEEGDISETIRGTAGMFTVGVLHCSVGGRDAYAPTTVDALRDKDVDYWALGHIHRRAVLLEHPHIVYPGNTQGNSPNEPGVKGAYLVTVSDGLVTDMEFFRTCGRVWRNITVDITEKTVPDIADSVGAQVERGDLARIVLVGRGDADRIARSSPRELMQVIEGRTGCRCESVAVESMPDIDLESRMRAGDIVARSVAIGLEMARTDRESILDMICRPTAGDVRSALRALSDEEFESMIMDAIFGIVADTGGAR